MNDSMQALGWTLVHFCWQAAAIALLYRILDVAFFRSRSSVRYALALAAMMSMFLVSVGTLVYEEMRIVRSDESPLIAQRPVDQLMQGAMASVSTAMACSSSPVSIRNDASMHQFVTISGRRAVALRARSITAGICLPQWKSSCQSISTPRRDFLGV